MMMRPLSGRSQRLRSISVADAHFARECGPFQAAAPLYIADHSVDFVLLILAQRLSRKKIEGPGVRILEKGLHDGQVVAQRFSGCSRLR